MAKAILAFLAANVFLWGAFLSLGYSYVKLVFAGAIIPAWLFSLLGVILVVCVVFSYLTTIIFEKL